MVKSEHLVNDKYLKMGRRTLPRLRVIMLVVLAATPALRPNSSTARPSGWSLSGSTLENVWRFVAVLGEGGTTFSLSLLEAVLRRKLRPRMDLRPPLLVFSSPAAATSGPSCAGDGICVTTLPVEDLREKNGIPDGVRRGLRRLERERPGLVVTTAGGAKEVWLPIAVRVVLLLLALEVRGRLTIEAARSLRNVVRTLDPVASWSRVDDARPTMSFVEAARRRGYRCSEP